MVRQLVPSHVGPDSCATLVLVLRQKVNPAAYQPSIDQVSAAAALLVAAANDNRLHEFYRYAQKILGLISLMRKAPTVIAALSKAIDRAKEGHFFTRTVLLNSPMVFPNRRNCEQDGRPDLLLILDQR